MPRKAILRLAMFTDSLEPSGVGRVMETVARHLPRDRYKLFLVCADDPGADGLTERMRAYVTTVARYTLRGDDHLPALHALVDRLRAWRVDIFHNHIGATWEGDWGTLAARCAGVPLVVATEHLPNVLRIPHEVEHRRRLNGLLDRIFTVSDSVRASLTAAGLAPAEKIITIDNGVDEHCWPHGQEQARRDLGLEVPIGRGTVILFLGRLVEQKDPATLIRAVHCLVDEGAPVRVLFAGDGPLRPDLEQVVRRLALQEHVRFLGSRPDVERLIAAADVLAMPSRFEGLPLAALEAMSAGLPVVGCDAPGVRDAVLHGVNGWLAPVGDAGELARGLRLALDPETRPRWGRASRERYEERFTAHRMAQELDRQYRIALANLASPGPSRARTAPISTPIGPRAEPLRA